VTPEISEFSYGFALTNELVGLAPLKAAPIFPSLIEEGKKGGGYDVKLQMPSLALFLQFKRAHCMTRPNAKEIKQYKIAIQRPFYRFHIMEASASNQHSMLLELDNGAAEVFYAAPRFHLVEEINSAWATNQVGTRSIFVRPRHIGALVPGPHHVAYDKSSAYVCSEPKKVTALSFVDLANALNQRLAEESLSLADRLPALMSEADAAYRRGVSRMAASATTDRQRSLFADFVRGEQFPPTPIDRRVAMRTTRTLDGARQMLRDLADKAATRFGAQLIIVQKND
jgi:hypothetical protein